MSTKRILIPDKAYDGVAISTAFEQLANELEINSTLGDCVLYIPTKGSLQGTSLEKILGKEISAILRKKKEVSFGAGMLRVETNQTFKSYTACDAVVVIYADQKMMDNVDSNRTPKLVICVPHLPEAVDGWKMTWSPITPDGNQQEVELIGNKIVEAALSSITHRINLSNHALGVTDKEAVKDVFYILRAHQQAEDLANIRAWCVKHGWNAKTADEAVKYAGSAFRLQSKPTSYGTHWAKDIYDQWVAGSKS